MVALNKKMAAKSIGFNGVKFHPTDRGYNITLGKEISFQKPSI